MSETLSSSAKSADPRPELAVLRDRLVSKVYSLTEIELLDFIDRFGLRQADDPEIIRYPGGRMKLSTDPADMPPYGEPVTMKDWLAEIDEAEAQIARGQSVSWEELQRDVLSKY